MAFSRRNVVAEAGCGGAEIAKLIAEWYRSARWPDRSAQYANRPALPIAVSSTNRDPLWLLGLKSMTYPPTLKLCIESSVFMRPSRVGLAPARRIASQRTLAPM